MSALIRHSAVVTLFLVHIDKTLYVLFVFWLKLKFSSLDIRLAWEDEVGIFSTGETVDLGKEAALKCKKYDMSTASRRSDYRAQSMRIKR